MYPLANIATQVATTILVFASIGVSLAPIC